VQECVCELESDLAVVQAFWRNRLLWHSSSMVRTQS
jgi:hypothetical protein